MTEKNNKQVATWLLIGAAMIIIQILIGGITRLTESGLSITEWKPVTGALPPLNDSEWQAEFNKYRQTDQFKYVHQHFTLQDFKFIFFWEWLHRVWARLLGIVFLAGFFYFLLRKKISRSMIMPMVLLFILGGLQGAIGWLMVKSGLVPEKYFVGHIELTTHLVAALILLVYTLWFAYHLIPSMQVKHHNTSINKILKVLVILFFIQLIYGGLMAGLKAAAVAPTWPDLNGSFLPGTSNAGTSWKIFNDPLVVQFIHRSVAYLLFACSIYFFVLTKYTSGLFRKFRNIFVSMIFLQVLLGIFTVLFSTVPDSFLLFGIAHQFVAMLLLVTLTSLVYLAKPAIANN